VLKTNVLQCCVALHNNWTAGF